jgi:sugar phosphate isomerase/epimerase
MKIGVLSEQSIERLDHLKGKGFRSFEWNRFQESPVALASTSEWKALAQAWGNEIQSRELTLSAIGAIYCNSMAPSNQSFVRDVMLRAIDVAELLGVQTVACFSGAVIETYENPRRGAVSEKMFDEFIPELCRYWKPIAQAAEAKGIRIAFENCPQGPYRLPVMGSNLMAQPASWSKVFHEIDQQNVGLEWDPSHLICLGVDLIENLKEFGSRVFHVHAKDAELQRDVIRRYGRCHPDAARHRFPGMGEANWKEIIQTLRDVGYDSDLTIEGWHDPVFKGDREEEGLLLAKTHLEQWV